MANEIKVNKITPEEIVQCDLDDISVGDRFMYDGVEYMRIEGWNYPPFVKGLALYVNLDNYTVSCLGVFNNTDGCEEDIENE